MSLAAGTVELQLEQAAQYTLHFAKRLGAHSPDPAAGPESPDVRFADLVTFDPAGPGQTRFPGWNVYVNSQRRAGA